jgi:hypothetical protein
MSRARLRRYNIVDARDQRDALVRRAQYLNSVRKEGVVPMAGAR